MATGVPPLLAQFEPCVGCRVRLRKPLHESGERRRRLIATARQRLGRPHLEHGPVGRGAIRLGVEQFLEGRGGLGMVL